MNRLQELEKKLRKLRRKKRIRVKGAYKSVGAEYERVAADNVNERAINCHCGKRVPKGEGVKVTYIHEGGFITRDKCFCSWECSPEILKSKMSKLTLAEFKKWIEGREFSTEPLKLGAGVTVIDREKFVKAHICILEARKTPQAKRRFMCYWDRLELFYNLVQAEIARKEL